jgi:hypothetical protein
MTSKKKPNIEKVAEELAALALRHLSSFPEEEQKRRILAAEKRLAAAGSTRSSFRHSRVPPPR